MHHIYIKWFFQIQNATIKSNGSILDVLYTKLYILK